MNKFNNLYYKIIIESQEKNDIEIIIPKFQETDFLKFVNKLNKKADRFQLPRLEVNKISEQIEKQSHQLVIFGEPGERPNVKNLENKNVKTVTYKIIGKPIQIEGYKLIGKVDDNGFSYIIGADRRIPETFRKFDTTRCDHCGTKHVRNKCFILYNTKDDEFVQIGSSCVKDFLGQHSFTAFKFYDSLIDYIKEYFEDLVGRGQGNYYGVGNLEDAILYSQVIFRENGYNYVRDSSEAVGRDLMVNKFVLADCLFSVNKGESEQIKKSITDQDRETAKKIIEWMENNDLQDGSYKFNIEELVKRGYVGEHEVGIVASIPMVYKKAIDKKTNKVKGNSKFQGTVGEKIFKDVKVIKVKKIETRFGISILLYLEDGDGNLYKSFYTGNDQNLRNAEIGNEFKISGNVKDHEIDQYHNKEHVTILKTLKVAK